MAWQIRAWQPADIQVWNVSLKTVYLHLCGLLGSGAKLSCNLINIISNNRALFPTSERLYNTKNN